MAPLLVSALLFALPLSAWLAHRRVSRLEWGWATLLTAALAVFVSLARTRPGDYEGIGVDGDGRRPGCLVLVAGCVAIAVRLSDWRRAILLAVAVGVMFGVVAVLTKIVMHILTEGGVSSC